VYPHKETHSLAEPFIASSIYAGVEKEQRTLKAMDHGEPRAYIDAALRVRVC
jgi:hypothetical protein